MIEGKWKIDRSYKNICIEMMTENLASLRAKADITQGEISNLIGISRQTYYAIETGQRTMSWNTNPGKRTLAYIFQLNPDAGELIAENLRSKERSGIMSTGTI